MGSCLVEEVAQFQSQGAPSVIIGAIRIGLASSIAATMTKNAITAADHLECPSVVIYHGEDSVTYMKMFEAQRSRVLFSTNLL